MIGEEGVDNHSGEGSSAMTLQEEIEAKVPASLRLLLDQRDGPAQLLKRLPTTLSPADVSTSSDANRVWELCGLHFLMNQPQPRFYEALGIFSSLYDHMLAYQETSGCQVPKGLPLVWMSECHARLGHTVLAKRYIMLTAIEDAIRERGHIPAETTGAYFRAVWQHGIPDDQLSRYAVQAWDLFQAHSLEARFPEWILQELDQDWVTEYPSPREAALYFVTTRYIRWLLSRLGAGDGKALEQLAHYLLSAMPGCRAYMRQRSESTDYDVVCTLEGWDLDFRSELGRYFVCECKDWSYPVDFSAFAKFCRVLDSIKCRFGILFSKHGITGVGRTKDAEREQLKVFQDRGMVIVVVSEEDLDRVASGPNFITMLRSKYEKVRLDLRE